MLIFVNPEIFNLAGISIFNVGWGGHTGARA